MKKILLITVLALCLTATISCSFRGNNSSFITTSYKSGNDGVVEDIYDLNSLVYNMPYVYNYHDKKEPTNKNFRNFVYAVKINNDFGTAKEDISTTAYFTKDAVLMESKGSRTNIKDSKITDVVNYDIEMYLTYETVFIKFNKYEYKNYDSSSAPGTKTQLFGDTIRSNYRKWIDISFKNLNIDDLYSDSDERKAKLEEFKYTAKYMYLWFISTCSYMDTVRSLTTFISNNFDYFEDDHGIFTLKSEEISRLHNSIGGFKGLPSVDLRSSQSPKLSFSGEKEEYDLNMSVDYNIQFKNIDNITIDVNKKVQINLIDFIKDYVDSVYNMD